MTRNEWKDVWHLMRRNLWHLEGERREQSRLAAECLRQRNSTDYPFAPLSWRLESYLHKKYAHVDDVEKVAQIFTDKVRAWNEGDDWERIKRGEIGADDVCDANQFMIDAFHRVFGREPRFASDVDEGFATTAQVDADFDLMENAWEEAKRIWRTL
jgi:hypothetical protein